MSGFDGQQLDATPISPERARAEILAQIAPLTPQMIARDDALGLRLAKCVVAPGPLPPFRSAAMDGYALRLDDLPPDRRLPVQATVAAGDAGMDLASGHTVRIMTGAVVPDAADTVVRFEDTQLHGDQLEVIVVPRRGRNVRPVGEDMPAGAEALVAGSVVGPLEIGVLAALGVSEVSARPRPRVAVLTTGDEVVRGSGSLRPGQIRDSNGPMLEAAIAMAGGAPTLVGHIGDDVETLRNALAGLDQFDLIVTTGGVSVGDFDVVKLALRAEGDVRLWQVAMKPGKPLAFGLLHGVPLLGLPGQPFSAFVSFTQFVRPALQRLQGAADPGPARIAADLTGDLPPTDRLTFHRGLAHVSNGQLVVEPIVRQMTSALSAAKTPNCLIHQLPSTVATAAGSKIMVEMLDGGSLLR